MFQLLVCLQMDGKVCKSVSLMEGFQLWILLNQLSDAVPAMHDLIHIKSKHGHNYRDVVAFFEANTCRVEVLDGRSQLERMYFPKPPQTVYLTPTTRDEVCGVGFVWGFLDIHP